MLQALDLQTVLIGVVIVVVLPVVVYLISVMGIREKSYEEAIAEQRHRNDAIFAPSKTASAKEGKRHRKLGGHKSKEKGGGGGGDLHVEFRPEAEIIPEEEQDDDDTPPRAKNARKSIEEPKSILVRKEKEKSPSVGRDAKSSSGAPAKQPETVTHKEKTPPKREEAEKKPSKKEEVEKRASKKEDSEKKPSSSSKKEEPDLKKPSKKEESDRKQRETSKDRFREIDAKEKQDLPSSEAAAAAADEPPVFDARIAPSYDNQALSAQRLTTLLNEAVLSHSEIHHLIELLLNRQHSSDNDDSEWLKPGQKVDPLSAVKKQLEEREESLAEEVARGQATTTKLRDVRQELTAEKTRSTQLERALKDKMQELQAMQQQLQRSSSDASAMQNKLQQLQSKFEEEHVLAIQKLKEENQQMRQAVIQIEAKSDNYEREKSELCSAISQLEASFGMVQTDNETWQAENQRLQGHLQTLELAKIEDGNAYKQHVAELMGQLHALEQEKLAVASDSAGLVQRLSDAQAIVTTHEIANSQMESVIEDLKHHSNELERQMASLQLQLQDEKSKLSKYDKELVTLKDENEMLALQVSQLSERQEAEGHEGSGDTVAQDKTNGHLQPEENGTSTKILLSEHEGILHEKEKLVDQLTLELKENSRLVQDLTGQVTSSKEEITRLVQNVDAQKAKNDELRQKNWRVVEALNVAEKSANDRIKEVERSSNERLLEVQKAEQKLAQDVLERIFPAVRIEKTNVGHADWVSQFETQACIRLEERLSDTKSRHSVELEEVQSRLSASDDNCAKLQAEINHYQNVLSTTEGILKKLQSSVEVEGAHWRDKLHEKDQELEKLRDENKLLLEKLEEVRVAQQTVAEERMESKLKLLKKDLNEVDEVDVRQVVEERDQARQLAEQVRERLNEVTGCVEKLTAERDSLIERLKGFESVGDEVGEERRKNKELGAEIMKLSGQLKSGVAALKAEQELVQELQARLEVNVSVATNGPPPEDNPATMEFESRSSGVDSGLWPPQSPSRLAGAGSGATTSPSSMTNESSSVSSLKKSKSRKRGVSAKK